jgi:hypothetical protein
LREDASDPLTSSLGRYGGAHIKPLLKNRISKNHNCNANITVVIFAGAFV